MLRIAEAARLKGPDHHRHTSLLLPSFPELAFGMGRQKRLPTGGRRKAVSQGSGTGSHMQGGQAARWSKEPQRREQKARSQRVEREEAAKRQAEAAGPAAASPPAKRSRPAVGAAQFSPPPYDLTKTAEVRAMQRDTARLRETLATDLPGRRRAAQVFQAAVTTRAPGPVAAAGRDVAAAIAPLGGAAAATGKRVQAATAELSATLGKLSSSTAHREATRQTLQTIEAAVLGGAAAAPGQVSDTEVFRFTAGKAGRQKLSGAQNRKITSARARRGKGSGQWWKKRDERSDSYRSPATKKGMLVRAVVEEIWVLCSQTSPLEGHAGVTEKDRRRSKAQMTAAESKSERPARERKVPVKAAGGLHKPAPGAFANASACAPDCTDDCRAEAADLPEVADLRVCTHSAGYVTAQLHANKDLMAKLTAGGVTARAGSEHAVCERIVGDLRPWWIVVCNIDDLDACACRHHLAPSELWKAMAAFRTANHGPDSGCTCTCNQCRPDGPGGQCQLGELDPFDTWVRNDWLCPPKWIELVASADGKSENGIGGNFSPYDCYTLKCTKPGCHDLAKSLPRCDGLGAGQEIDGASMATVWMYEQAVVKKKPKTITLQNGKTVCPHTNTAHTYPPLCVVLIYISIHCSDYYLHRKRHSRRIAWSGRFAAARPRSGRSIPVSKA